MARSNSNKNQQSLTNDSVTDTKKSESHYFKTLISGLAIQTSPVDPANPVAPKVVRFIPYLEKYQGDNRKVGYLKTSDKSLVKRLIADGNVEQISEKEYKDSTGKDSVRTGY